MRYIDKKSIAGVLFLSTSLVFAGCSEPTIDEEQAQQYVDQWSSSVEEFLHHEATRSAASEGLTRRMQAASTAEEARTDREGPPFHRIVNDVYGSREYQPALVGEEGLTPRGEAIWNVLLTLDDHRLDAGPYQLDEIAEALQKWEQQQGLISDFDELAATDKEREEARAWLVEQPVSQFALEDSNFEMLTTTLTEHDTYGQRLRGALNAYQQKRADLTETATEIEQRLVLGLARYDYQQRYFRNKEIFVHPRHWDYYNEPDVEDSGRRPDFAKGPYTASLIWRDAAHLAEEIAEEKGAELFHKKIAQTLIDYLEIEEPEAFIASIQPQQPQYAGLVSEYRRYREILEGGGWEKVERRDNLSPGNTHERIGELKRRLLAEAYFPADVEITDTFDEALTEAITAYQKTHQMAQTGRPHHIFWSSLNLTAERRLNQIGLNIERWRESNIDHSVPTYTFVNIPNFAVEVWHNQEVAQQNKTVVGNNEQAINPLTAEAEYSNRTPRMAAYIDRVIFNPYWNVTDRIRAESVLPEVRQSLEVKYANQLYALHQQVEASNEAAATATAMRGGASQGVRGRFGGTSSQRAGRANTGDVNDATEESTEDSEAAEPARELTAEEQAEARQRELAERRERALSTFTEMRRVEVNVEGSDRMERRRFFKLDEIDRIMTSLHGQDEEAHANFRKRFAYLDWESGEVDVENTDLENIPSWYEENGYDVVRVHNWEYVRMLPGPENALGRVKIIFPNYDNIYLHDTPAKSLFNRDVRGFSHGCIRVQDPLTLAETLLNFGGIDDANIDRILADEEYMPIFLKRQIPVFLEYYTVSVDEDGRANFLADVYGYDAEALSDDT